MTLQELIDHFRYVFGRRNRICLRGLRKRIELLVLGIGDLQDAVRKEVDRDIMGVALSRVLARIFFIVEYFHPYPFVETLARKYPMGSCSYCSTLPCSCDMKREPCKLADEASREQLQWTLADWYGHLDRLYGHRNRLNGVENVLIRLSREATEIISLDLQLSSPREEWTLGKVEQDFAEELADAFAWTVGAAVLLDIDLSDAVLRLYGDGCTRCGKSPCECSTVNVEQARWSRDLLPASCIVR